MNIQNLGQQKNNGNKTQTNEDCDDYGVKIFDSDIPGDAEGQPNKDMEVDAQQPDLGIPIRPGVEAEGDASEEITAGTAGGDRAHLMEATQVPSKPSSL